MEYNSANSTLTGYLNGVAGGSVTASKLYPSTLYYGLGATEATNGGNRANFSGALDEVRVSASARSADWIATEYNNQSNPATFYIIGSTDTSGTSGSPLITSLSPISGAVGSSVAISGVNFGSTGTVAFSGVTAATSNWSSTSITATVPNGAVSGNVVVTVSNVPSNGVNFTVSVGNSNSSWPNGYTYRRTIAIDHSKVLNTDQVNFPVLISGTYPYLAGTAEGGNVTSASRFDILFTSDANAASPLAFERESCNPSTGAVSFWVSVPTLSHTADAAIYLFYGNPAVITDPSNKAGVWDSNYKSVLHLSDNAASTTVADSTGGNNGTSQAPTYTQTTPGQIGGGLKFNRKN